eukprot:TRINITY_DN11514_c0_g1_i4.p1 TRINITY_DN11514_c0_g1~~TRINITY_DN11514_c0_g1_i4.p1  ORF type:complete len:1008 (-),score=279.97 TRINITY_DN11514_c0_g1_i4:52-2733(-)
MARALCSLGESTGDAYGIIPKQRFRVSRNKVLPSAIEVMKRVKGNNKFLLRIEYAGEKGVGDGPTKEFFTLVSREIQSVMLNMWLPGEEEAGANYIHSEVGLFPAPLTQEPSMKKNILNLFYFLGQLLGKALLDQNLLDIPFCNVFYKILLHGQEVLTINDLVAIFPIEGSEIVQLLKYSENVEEIRNSDLPERKKLEKINSLLYHGKPLEDALEAVVSTQSTGREEGETKVEAEEEGETKVKVDDKTKMREEEKEREEETNSSEEEEVKGGGGGNYKRMEEEWREAKTKSWKRFEECFQKKRVEIEKDQFISLWMNGRRIKPSCLAIHVAQSQFLRSPSYLEGSTNNTSMWEDVVEVMYKLDKGDECALSTGFGIDDLQKCREVFAFLEKDTVDLILFLWLLNFLNTMFYREAEVLQTDKEIFYNSKLTKKVERQLQDPLTLCSGAFPEWISLCMKYCHFLFPLDCRIRYFRVVSMGMARALCSLGESTGDAYGIIPKQRFRVSRNKVLPSAIEVMKRVKGNNKFLLRIEYAGEKGVGDGPTKEFFTLVSREIQSVMLNMWLPGEEEAGANYIHSEVGLFPAPLTQEPSMKKNILNLFYFLGQLLGKALLDQNLLDIPFCNVFYKILLHGQEVLTINDLVAIFPIEGSEIVQLLKYSENVEEIRNSDLPERKKLEKINSLLYHGKPLEDALLHFNSFLGVPLKEGGCSTLVTPSNVSEYISLLMDHYLGGGIKSQFEEIKRGFLEFLDLQHLQAFDVHELDLIFCGERSGSIPWTVEEIRKGIALNEKDFTEKSPVIQYFFEILTSFSVEQQRTFLVWATGTTRLPIGGFANLPKKITIMRKVVSDIDVDLEVPSVNVCFKQCKIPNYTSVHVMRERLIFAMGDGTARYLLD